MQLNSQSFTHGAVIPGEYAFAVVDPASHIRLSSNRNPHLTWTNAPAGTQSFVLICHDPDVPSRGDDVNQPDREIPATLARVDFFHWVLINLSPEQQTIVAGSHSEGITAHGKAGPMVAGDARGQLRHGINDYTGWFAGDPAMSGDYHGYDGPCPPWNDSIVHHYVFTLYALDVATLAIDGQITGPKVRAAMASHVLAEASLTGTYTLNPRLNK
ncbi:YbhB/YbcL family Raf kinase inhibitor-like protein [Chitinimonas sp. BJB300]|uniref:YbhB/YbcL family Raf kinase inhibitor-like protein n=1 Tax=Chitinimonas sp. BJB300 TaxID=1559339 RepID=UPI000C0F488A|nr:YbhB/YbcL family Raf kinase inhibitor-like protein [Chitinimonas sp. BJB300]PHV10741.1 YbhB/YbcL family Raf kinase inhibitor-like protein [Chitinimonas sp. BJB300]TSJ91241.1 YbhB/YbcL family Raf kinase inhibitor-like protein [Chitinimonas sp. BJB300]